MAFFNLRLKNPGVSSNKSIASPASPLSPSSPFLLLVTLLVALFMLAPMLLSVVAGLVNNYSQGLSSGLTLRWLAAVWEGYGNTVGA